ncbi:arylamine N-acetyltransferase [Rhodococcus sp. D2-41]|uniref:arylamine N-acetyltransferase family protein n=1 Tax=Speluncibacter jeojiensis TaxID=2710754 RepID=UPI002410011B|nr:arylamine N-acetyltransferase [Rhodococcus sp. D2-41]MDG3011351.1 arylamine N-acetyltransferase [Rhodococcus sp. D2-41]
MTTTADFDLDAYLTRIGFTGERTPTRATLDAIAAAHTATIPFENLDPVLGVPNRLDLASLQAKLVDGGRGGYCFEHGLLLRTALLTLGYRVTALAGRVLWGTDDPHAITGRTHMLLLVDLGDERRIIDTGFGGMTLTGTLRLELDTVQSTPLEPFRLIELDGDWALQAQIGEDRWRTTYRFDLQPQHPIDYEPANWYLSTWPQSRFVTMLMAARATTDRRYALAGRQLTVHHADGTAERRVLTGFDEFRTVLERDLLIDTSGLTGLRAAFDRLD